MFFLHAPVIQMLWKWLHKTAKRDVCIANPHIQVLECMTHMCVLYHPVPSTPWTRTRGSRCRCRSGSTCGLACPQRRWSSTPSQRELSVSLLSWYVALSHLSLSLSSLSSLSFEQINVDHSHPILSISTFMILLSAQNWENNICLVIILNAINSK